MASKRNFERDLINVNISRKDWNKLILRRRFKEPFYSILHRFVELQDITKDDLDYENEILRESVQTWMTRALKAESNKQVTLNDY